jgi:hypothetical protein
VPVGDVVRRPCRPHCGDGASRLCPGAGGNRALPPGPAESSVRVAGAAFYVGLMLSSRAWRSGPGGEHIRGTPGRLSDPRSMLVFRSVAAEPVSFVVRSFCTNSRPALRAAACGGRPRSRNPTTT